MERFQLPVVQEDILVRLKMLRILISSSKR
jgi:hypothetical protein